MPKCTERLRITPSPYLDDGLIDTLAEALVDVWGKLNLPLKQRALAAELQPVHPRTRFRSSGLYV
jgi:5-aminolevulinate synthase